MLDNSISHSEQALCHLLGLLRTHSWICEAGTRSQGALVATWRNWL
jgi:hypothetical protein